MNKIITLIIIILFFKFIQSQIDIIEIKSDDTLYIKNPEKSISDFCSFSFTYLTVFPEPKFETDGSIIGIFENATFTQSYLLSNDTCYLNQYIIPSIPFGNYVFTVKSNSTSGEKFLSTSFSCEPIDVSKLKFSFTPHPISLRHVPYQKGVLRIVGLNSSCSLESKPYYQLQDTGFGYYYIPNFNDFSLSDENATFFFFNSNYTMTIPTIYKNYSNIIGEIKPYPIKDNVIKLGKYQGPFFTFQTYFSSDDNPYFIIKPDFSSPVLLYGSEINNSYTYTITQSSFGNFNASLYSQKFSEIVNVYNFLKNVKQYNLSVMPSNADISYENIGNFSLFTIAFTNSDHYDYSKYVFMVNSFYSPLLQWPYGFLSGNNNKYDFRIRGFNLPIPVTQTSSFTNLNFLNSNGITFGVNYNTIEPGYTEIIMFNFAHLFDSTYIFRITVKQNGENLAIKEILFGTRSFSFDKMIPGGNKAFATFEIVYDYRNEYFETIALVNSLNLIHTYHNGDWYSINPMLQIKLPDLQEIDIFSIKDVSFLYNNVIVSNENLSNIIYFNISNLDSHNIPIFSMILNDPVSEKNLKYYYSTWSDKLKMFQIEFFIPANTLSGILPYSLFLSHKVPLKSSFLSLSSQLHIKSKYLDSYGPIFSEFKNKTINSTTFGWEFYIEDSINGFHHGEIIVRGDLDSSIYKFQISSLNNLLIGNKYRGKYEILINLKTNICASQNYIITSVNLYDTQSNLATFSKLDSNQQISYKTPFINYMDNPDILKHFKDCGNYEDETPPKVNHFEMKKNGSEILVFDILVEDIESGLKYDQHPIVYLTSEYLDVVECISEIISINSTNAKYRCEMKVPYGFGYGCGVLVGVYGFINNGGSYSGFEENYDGSIMDYSIYPNLVITNTSSITSNGDGSLWIMGSGFDGYINVKVYYSDTKLTPPSDNLSPIIIYYSALIITGLKATDKPFTIQIEMTKSSETYISNIYTVNPVVFDYSYVEPTTTPLPTTPPQKCIGSPECGGLGHGYCNGLQGCVCYSPWVGLDCTSKVVVIPPPKLNSTIPTSELPVLGEGENTNNSTNILFKSLVSIVSLRELNFQGNVVNEFKFEKWIYSEINSNKHQYFTNISVSPTVNFLTTSTTDIKVTIQWFPNQTTIEFANQSLIMNPSTVKYTIEIGSYNFKNKLNQLQLVLSASMDSSNINNICSKSEFGNTNSADNSNYVKIQVDNHSLYGRFIKRAIIDSQVISIENEQLDSSMNPINNASSSQSFIGITIPYYLYNIIIDPDFSVLIDSKKVSSNDENSICSKSSSNSSLTVSQLAGIIIASAFIFLSICAALIFILIKKRKHTLLLIMAKDIVLKRKK
ncbi:hypothetical protein ACTFIW_002305 [Dictyostelium discoideum]